MSEPSIFDTPEPNPITLSPCVRNCCLDENDHCCGCKRTLDEIIGWSTYSKSEKLAILQQLKERD